jgi:peptidoglycan/LPS O-acetylase OafA/YrhL
LGLISILKYDKSKLAIIWILYVGFLILDSYGVSTRLFVFKISAFNFVRFFVYFYSGVLYFFYMKNRRPHGAIVLSAILAAVLCRGTNWFEIVSLIAIVITVFWFAFLDYRPLQFIVSKGDFSYGLYIYGSIIQNFIHYYYGCSIPLYLKIPLSLLLTFPFAYFSWKFIESKALKLKLKL